MLLEPLFVFSYGVENDLFSLSLRVNKIRRSLYSWPFRMCYCAW
jgi:hypothetical protein